MVMRDLPEKRRCVEGLGSARSELFASRFRILIYHR